MTQCHYSRPSRSYTAAASALTGRVSAESESGLQPLPVPLALLLLLVETADSGVNAQDGATEIMNASSATAVPRSHCQWRDIMQLPGSGSASVRQLAQHCSSNCQCVYASELTRT